MFFFITIHALQKISKMAQKSPTPKVNGVYYAETLPRSNLLFCVILPTNQLTKKQTQLKTQPPWQRQ